MPKTIINIPKILKYYKTTLIIFFVNVISYNSFSQTQPIFQKIDQSKGLSSSKITGIIKENNGFIWISTQNGLNRYDGHSVRVYNKRNSNIQSNDISSLFLDSKNRIWFTSYGSGLNLYDKLNDQFITFKNSENNKHSIISNKVNAITENSKGLFWIGTEKGLCLFDYNLNKFYRYIYNEQQPLNITSIYEDKKGNLYIGTFKNGLLVFNTKSKVFEKINNGNTPITSRINVITELNSDKILLGTASNGLISVDLKTHKVSSFFL